MSLRCKFLVKKKLKKGIAGFCHNREKQRYIYHDNVPSKIKTNGIRIIAQTCIGCKYDKQ